MGSLGMIREALFRRRKIITERCWGLKMVSMEATSSKGVHKPFHTDRAKSTLETFILWFGEFW
jgi:hypothetical protein